VPDAVRRAQAVPQAVGDLILAQAGRLGDLCGGVFARQRGGAAAQMRASEVPASRGLNLPSAMGFGVLA